MKNSATISRLAFLSRVLACLGIFGFPALPAGAQAVSATHNLPEPATNPGIQPRFMLMNPLGRAVSTHDFSGRYQLVTFGFVSCPDVCPTTLLEFKQILDSLGDDAKQLQAIFITVDPERDTLAVLREYTQAFDARILGLTGPPEFIRRAAESFRVQYEKVSEPGAAANIYTMNHTAGMVLLDTDGRFVMRFPYAKPVPEIAQEIRQVMAAGKAQKDRHATQAPMAQSQ